MVTVYGARWHLKMLRDKRSLTEILELCMGHRNGKSARDTVFTALQSHLRSAIMADYVVGEFVYFCEGSRITSGPHDATHAGILAPSDYTRNSACWYKVRGHSCVWRPGNGPCPAHQHEGEGDPMSVRRRVAQSPPLAPVHAVPGSEPSGLTGSAGVRGAGGTTQRTGAVCSVGHEGRGTP